MVWLWPILVTVTLPDDLDTWLNPATVSGSALLTLHRYYGTRPWLVGEALVLPAQGPSVVPGSLSLREQLALAMP